MGEPREDGDEAKVPEPVVVALALRAHTEPVSFWSMMALLPAAAAARSDT